MKKPLIILITLSASIVLAVFTTHVVSMEHLELIMQKSGVRCYFKKIIRMISERLNSGPHDSNDLNIFHSFSAVTSRQ